MPELPAMAFGEISARLVHFAQEAHRASIEGEIVLARAGLDTGERYPGTEHWIREKREAAAMAAALQRFFAEAAEDEEIIVEFLAALPRHRELVRDFLAGLPLASETARRGAA